MMKRIDYFIPTRIVFGAGRLKELATLSLPGKKALLCVTEDKLMEKLGIQQRVIELLGQNGVSVAVFDKVTPNPTRTGVMAAAALAKESGCDFVIGLGGGSSIDTAKAASIMMANPGDLWDYASAGSGGRKPVSGAFPVVAISTTAGTGTEADPYAVVTNEETNEKLDFTLDEIFPAISIIDPELMLTLPHKLTLFQGFDALFHASECYVNNGNENRLTELFAVDAIEKVAKHLPIVSEDGSNLESRSNISYAANILCGFTQSLVCTTSHHIIAQALGGFFPNVPHGASLLLIADAYYKKVCSLLPTEFDAIGEIMGEKADPAKPGYAFVTALAKLMERTGMDKLAMSDFNINKDDLPKVAHIAAAEVGFECDRLHRHGSGRGRNPDAVLQVAPFPFREARGVPLPARAAGAWVSADASGAPGPVPSPFLCGGRPLQCEPAGGPFPAWAAGLPEKAGKVGLQPFPARGGGCIRAEGVPAALPSPAWWLGLEPLPRWCVR